MISIIWSIVVCYIIYRLVINRKNTGGGNGGTGNRPVIHTTPMQHREQQSTGPVNHQAGRPANGRVKQTPQKQAAGNRPGGQEVSTMAYLEEKARQDAAEHARDKWEENKRLHQNYGGLRVAERLFDGDSVPGGKKCVVCGYCGAENLVPMMPRERFSCYFCREPLR